MYQEMISNYLLLITGSIKSDKAVISYNELND